MRKLFFVLGLLPLVALGQPSHGPYPQPGGGVGTTLSNATVYADLKGKTNGPISVNTEAGNVFVDTVGGFSAGGFIGSGNCYISNALYFGGSSADIFILAGVNNTNCGNSEVLVGGGSGNAVFPGDFSGFSLATDGVMWGGNQNTLLGGSFFTIIGSSNFGTNVAGWYVFGNLNTNTNRSGVVQVGSGLVADADNEVLVGAATNRLRFTQSGASYSGAPLVMDGQGISNRVNSVLVADTVLNQSGNWVGMMAGAHALTLPSATTNTGYLYTLTCASAGTNAIKTVSNQNIDGVNGTTGTGFTLSNQWCSVTLRSDGTQWIIISGYFK